MAVLTDKQEAMIGSIGLTGIATHGTGLTAVVGIHLESHRTHKCGFIGNHAMQLGKGPSGIDRIGLALFPTGFLARTSAGSCSDICQVFQSDECLWVCFHHAFRDDVISVLLQPSLSSAYLHQTARCSTSAFSLKTLLESCIVVRFGNHRLSRIKVIFSFPGGTDRQVTYPNINPYHVLVTFGSWVCSLHLQGHKQVELFPGFVIPEFGSPNMSPMLYEYHVFAIATIGDNDTSIQGEKTHPLLSLQTVVTLIVVGQGRGDICRSLVKSLVAFLGESCLTQGCILLDFCPQGLVSGPYLPGDIAGHLCWQVIVKTNIGIGGTLQSLLIAHLAMLKSVTRDIVTSITTGQLGLP